MDLTKLARGQPCLIRLSGCDGGSESGTTVHKRIGLFDTAEEAHAAYVAEASTAFGEFARSK